VFGTCRVPGSKSMTNRALLLAGFAAGSSHLSNLANGQDAAAAQQVLERLGIACAADLGPHAEAGAVHIHGCAAQVPRTQAELWLGDAGTLARFVPGLLAASSSGDWQLDGSAQLRRRPLAPLVAALQQLGGRLSASAQGGLPLRVRGGGLVDGPRGRAPLTLGAEISSQFLSGVLMAAAVAQRPLTVRTTTPVLQPAYIEMTQACLAAFGVPVLTPAPHTWQVVPAPLQGCTMAIEADASTACYFWAAAAVTGGRVCVANMTPACRQADMALLPLLARMGCSIEPSPAGIAVAGPKQLRGGFAADLSALSDQTPTAAVLAALCDAPVQLTGVAHVRHHESDRLAAMTQALRALGGAVTQRPDGLHIVPAPLHAGDVQPHADHRVAMAMALVGLRVPGVRIGTPACVAKTCPEYFTLLQQLGVAIRWHG
jgi:3-phosphoshikimate 1-carboxyvinyltransferase